MMQLRGMTYGKRLLLWTVCVRGLGGRVNRVF